MKSGSVQAISFEDLGKGEINLSFQEKPGMRDNTDWWEGSSEIRHNSEKKLDYQMNEQNLIIHFSSP